MVAQETLDCQGRMGSRGSLVHKGWLETPAPLVNLGQLDNKAHRVLWALQDKMDSQALTGHQGIQGLAAKLEIPVNGALRGRLGRMVTLGLTVTLAQEVIRGCRAPLALLGKMDSLACKGH